MLDINHAIRNYCYFWEILKKIWLWIIQITAGFPLYFHALSARTVGQVWNRTLYPAEPESNSVCEPVVRTRHFISALCWILFHGDPVKKNLHSHHELCISWWWDLSKARSCWIYSSNQPPCCLAGACVFSSWDFLDSWSETMKANWERTNSLVAGCCVFGHFCSCLVRVIPFCFLLSFLDLTF